MAELTNSRSGSADIPRGLGYYRFLYFSELLKRHICVGTIKNRIGKLTDLVFALSEPYPDVVGIYIEHGWGKPTEFVPWENVVKIEDDAIFVQTPDQEKGFPPFVDQPGWILLDKHLMGRTIIDIDGRRSEVVNDVHLLEAKGRLLLVHVDISMSGFLRRLKLGKRRWVKDNLISWKYVQPLSLEDAVSTDKVTLSVTRRQMLELPSEDLADVLEELPGEEQQALFSALDSEKAAETLVEAEPRAQRQIIASLRAERARNILSEMSIPQLVGLFSVLPHDDVEELMALLGEQQAQRVRDILSEREVKAKDIMSADFIQVTEKDRVRDALFLIRHSGREPENISYLYVVNGGKTLLGVIDLRDLVLADDDRTMADIMVSPVVTAEEDDLQEDLAEIFAKYHYRMIPVVDERDRILGIINYNDIMKGIETRVKI
jgi:CBS domain-containing protein/sporulation protein YlmC with PRC-barrel domain